MSTRYGKFYKKFLEDPLKGHDHYRDHPDMYPNSRENLYGCLVRFALVSIKSFHADFWLHDFEALMRARPGVELIWSCYENGTHLYTKDVYIHSVAPAITKPDYCVMINVIGANSGDIIMVPDRLFDKWTSVKN